MKKLVLLLGGVRSGKSAYAQKLAAELGGRVTYIATAEAGDEEMARRIEAHRRERPARWRTVEAPEALADTLRSEADSTDIILVDCLTVYVSNLLMKLPPEAMDDAQAHGDEFADTVRAEMRALLEAYEQGTATVIIVSNEVGMGLVPPYPMGRLYRDALGLANQLVGTRADEVYMLFAGIPVELKALARGTQ